MVTEPKQRTRLLEILREHGACSVQDVVAAWGAKTYSERLYGALVSAERAGVVRRGAMVTRRVGLAGQIRRVQLWEAV